LRSRSRRVDDRTRSRDQQQDWPLDDPFGVGYPPQDTSRWGAAAAPVAGNQSSDSEMLLAMARGITTMASLHNEKVLRDRLEKSVLGRLSKRQTALFTLL